MPSILRSMKSDRTGNVAVLFSIAVVPIMGFAGAAMDYSRATSLKAEMRTVADRAAVSIVLDLQQSSEASIKEDAAANLLGRHGSALEKVTVEGDWIDADHYRIVVTSNLRSSLMSAIPLQSGTITTSVETVARRPAMTWIHGEPDVFPLDAKANDYNRIYTYCFNPNRTDDDDKGRRDIRPLFDNGLPETVYDEGLAECSADETLSFKMRNVRRARKNPEEWDDPNQRVYKYFSDSVLDPDTRIYTHNHVGYRIRNGWRYDEITLEPDTFETVLCETKDDCVPIAEGGVLPDYEEHREANVATEPCEPGQFMYFAWEDRPTGHGWTDMDFNDIRFVMACPDLGISSSSIARIVR
jgi:Flp pilus assembly protein TadG